VIDEAIVRFNFDFISYFFVFLKTSV